jgi:hypothetical protein
LSGATTPDDCIVANGRGQPDVDSQYWVQPPLHGELRWPGHDGFLVPPRTGAKVGRPDRMVWPSTVTAASR